MSNEDDEDELPVPGLKHMDIVHPYPVESPGVALEGLNALFAMGFTVPVALRMNSVYGKFGYSKESKPGTHMASVVMAYFMVKRARAALRVV